MMNSKGLYHLPFLITILLSLSNYTKASLGSKDSLLFSCIFATSSYKFDYSAPENSQNKFWQPYCNYQPILGTLVYCFNDYKSDGKELEYTYNKFIHNCKENGEVSNFDKDFLINSLKNATTYIEDSNSTVVLHTTPIHIDSSKFTNLRSSYISFVYNFVLTNKIANVMCSFWAVSLLIIGLLNHIRKYKLCLSLLTGPISNKIRSKLTLPTFLSLQYHSQPFNIFGERIGKQYLSVFDGILPTNQESIILIIYFGFTFGFLLIDYKFQELNLLLGDYRSQLARYVADRTGILAFAQLPPLFLFGGRNNILINLSGLPFSSFIVFHKWISRAMVLLAAVHAYTFKIYFYLHNHLEQERKTWLWIFGEYTLTFSILILIFAIFKFRARFYELFLVIHISLALLFIFGALLHVAKIGYLEWIYATLAIWALDRIIRVYNLYKFGFPVADLEIIHDTIVVTIPKPINSKAWKTHPGQFAYIYFLNYKLPFWQSHPFTFYDTTTYNELNNKSTASTHVEHDQSQLENGNSIKIYIKIKNGISLKLYNYVEQLISADENSQVNGRNNKKHVSVRIGLEGPYAHHVNFRSYDSILLMAGGNGVPGPYYHALNLIKHNYPNQTVDFVWTVKSLKNLKVFYSELLQLMKLDPENRIKKSIYVTRDKIPGPIKRVLNSPKPKHKKETFGELSPLIEAVEEDLEEYHSHGTPMCNLNTQMNSLIEIFQKLSHGFEFIEGRPNIPNHLHQYIHKPIHPGQQADENQKRVAVVSCGPDVMCDEIRDVVALIQGEQSTSRIDLYEELQVW